MWGQVVVALRDDDTTRRIACADADDDPKYPCPDGGQPPSRPVDAPTQREDGGLRETAVDRQ